jgi:hypothetical protein
MRYNEFKTVEGLDSFMNILMGKGTGLGNLGGLADKAVDAAKDALSDKPGEAPKINQSTGTVANGYTPKGATPEQMKQFGPSSQDKINWKDMRSYIANKLSINHAVAMVVNCKWESGFQPGRWVHSDASQGPSGGLFMFHDANFSGRGFFSDMVAACGGPGKWQTNWQGQIDFALSYTKSKGPAFASTKFKTPEEATYWFCVNFERPQNAEAKGRERAKEAHLYAK